MFKKEKNDKPPNVAVANGGQIPDTLKFKDTHREVKAQNINAEQDLDDLMCTANSPVSSFGYVHDYTAGSQKSFQGHIFCSLLISCMLGMP